MVTYVNTKVNKWYKIVLWYNIGLLQEILLKYFTYMERLLPSFFHLSEIKSPEVALNHIKLSPKILPRDAMCFFLLILLKSTKAMAT